MASDTVAKRYFAQVGSELLEVDPEHVDLHKGGASFSTSSPVLFYQIKATLGDPDKGPATVLTGIGASWSDAEANLEQQMPKEQP